MPPKRGLPAPSTVLLVVLTGLAVVLAAKALRPPSIPSRDVVRVADPSAAPGGPASSPPSAATPSPSAASPGAGPGVPTVRPRHALLAAGGAATWRWTGDARCPGGTGELARSTDGGATWEPVALPSAAPVVDVDAASGDVVVVTTLDAGCDRAPVLTVDGGATWRDVPDGTAASDLGVGRPEVVWAVRDRAVATLGGDGWRVGADPCDEPDDPDPALIAGISPTEAVVVCQRRDGSGRLLVRTYDGGRTWRRLAGRRTETGLAGRGRIARLRFGDRSRGVVVVERGRCRTGELRVTADAGESWTTLPCPAVDGYDVAAVLDVVPTPDGGWLAAARTADAVVLLTSADGRGWRAAGG